MRWAKISEYLILVLNSSLAFYNINVYDHFYFPEIISLFILPILFLLSWKNIFSDFQILETAILIYFFIEIIRNLYTPCGAALHEVFIQLYLIIFYFTIRASSISYKLDFLKIFSKSLVIILLISVPLAVIGFIHASISSQTNALAWFYPGFPILGDIARGRAFLGTPEMLAYFLITSYFILLINKDNQILGINKSLYFFLCLIGLVCSASKSFLVFLALLLIYYYPKKRVLKNIYLFSIFLLLFLYFFGTHFLVRNKNSILNSDISGETIAQINQYSISKSSYTELKEIAIQCGLKNPIIGVGSSCFGEYYSNHRSELNIRNSLPIYDPHSTWFGQFAENGIIGCLCLLLLCFAIYFQMKNRWDSITLLILFYLLISMNTDILNFRQFWLILLLISLTKFKQSDNNPFEKTM